MLEICRSLVSHFMGGSFQPRQQLYILPVHAQPQIHVRTTLANMEEAAREKEMASSVNVLKDSPVNAVKTVR